MDEPTAASRQHESGETAARCPVRGGIPRMARYAMSWREPNGEWENEQGVYTGAVLLDGPWFHALSDEAAEAGQGWSSFHASCLLWVEWAP